MRQIKKILMILAVVLCFCAVQARADLITIAISGQVTGVNDQYGDLQNQVHAGDTISGTYTYDSTASGPPYDFYSSPCGVSLNVGGLNFATDSTNVWFHMVVINNDSQGMDGYDWRSYYNSPLSNGTPVYTLGWQLTDPSGMALSSEALPLTAPDLSKWPDNALIIAGPDEYGYYGFGITATITSAEVVPEPATLLILAFGSFFVRKSAKRTADKSVC